MHFEKLVALSDTLWVEVGAPFPFTEFGVRFSITKVKSKYGLDWRVTFKLDSPDRVMKLFGQGTSLDATVDEMLRKLNTCGLVFIPALPE